MKLILEEEMGKGEEKTIVKVKEITNEKEATKGQFIHKCYHDEPDKNGCCKPCIRRKV